MSRGPRRCSTLYHPDQGPYEEWLAGWAAQGMVLEYPWDPSSSDIGGRTVWPIALIDAAWLEAHPGYRAAYAVAGRSGG